MNSGEQTQILNIKVVDLPGVPQTGFAGSGRWIVVAAGVALLLIALLILLWRRHSGGRFGFKQKFVGLTALVLALGLTLVAAWLVKPSATVQTASAAPISSLAVNGGQLNLTVFKGQAAAGSLLSQTTVKTDNAAGYEILAKVNADDSEKLKNAGIKMTIQGGRIKTDTDLLLGANETLTVDRRDNPSATGGDATPFTIKVNAPGDVPSGNYKLDLTYDLVNLTSPTPTTMQGLTADYCNNKMSIGQVITLTDTRNNQPYNVRKMEDGRCWMVNNLKLGQGHYATGNSDGVDAAGGLTIPAPTTGSYIPNAYIEIHYADPGDPGTAGFDANNSGSNDINSDNFYGYLYNWCAVAAGNSANCVDGATTPSDISADYNICPTGWRVPTGNTGGDFATLNNSMKTSLSANDWDNWQSNGAWRGTYAGYYNYQILEPGSYGYYWSASGAPSQQGGGSGTLWIGYAHSFFMDKPYQTVYPVDANPRDSSGFAVRCLLK
ncbi:MAG: fibrobacter succinogenes major paralogous domain-containing protein [Candidatus Nomurabacteria bacterium]|jgi:uncharacterized protein (TIGR02145 family)|nr:fibrobacter succinogenes major paralogous domain-containing protein [Candidatus Nomurabacteria bacterium]